MSFLKEIGKGLRGIGKVLSTPQRLIGKAIGGDAGRFIGAAASPGGLAMAPLRRGLETGSGQAVLDEYRDTNLNFAAQAAPAAAMMAGGGAGGAPGSSSPVPAPMGSGAAAAATATPSGSFLGNVGRYMSKNPDFALDIVGTGADIYGAAQTGRAQDRYLDLQEREQEARLRPRQPFRQWQAGQGR